MSHAIYHRLFPVFAEKTIHRQYYMSTVSQACRKSQGITAYMMPIVKKNYSQIQMV